MPTAAMAEEAHAHTEATAASHIVFIIFFSSAVSVHPSVQRAKPIDLLLSYRLTQFERVQGEIRTLMKAECTGRMVFFSRSSLERVLTRYREDHNDEGLQNRLLKCPDGHTNLGGRVLRCCGSMGCVRDDVRVDGVRDP